MKSVLLSFLFLYSLSGIAQSPSVVKALASTALVPNDKDQEGWKNNEWNGLFFYQGTGSPTKLCVTDGTNAGTQYLLDIGSGTVVGTFPAQDFMYIITSRIASFSPILYEAQIWKSNGTAGGTSLVYTMPQTSISNACTWTSDRDAKRNFSVNGNTLFFGGYDAVNGNELWVTDGTAAGTHIVKDIKPGTGNSSPWAFCKIGSDVFFTSMQTGLERKLWKTDGTEAGTVQVPVAEPFYILDNAVGIVNNKMIFYAHNTVDGYEPYVSDGSAAGTFMLKDINTSGNSWLSQSQNAHLRFNSRCCFFVAYNGTANALWRTDGTSAGTIQLTSNAQAAFSGVSGGSYTDVDETGLWMLEYNAAGSGSSEKLYRSDGTVAGTYQVTTALSYAQYVKIYKGALWMASRNTASAANVEPWRSGGNATTTNKAFEIAPGTAGSPLFTPISANPFGFFVKNGRLYFFASSNAAPDRNLYQYTGDFTFNGTVAGGNWKDSANWNGMLPPGITDSVYINSGAPNTLTVSGSNAYAGTLLMGNNASAALAAVTDSIIVNTGITAAGNNSFNGNGVLALKNSNTDSAVQISNGFTASQLAIMSHADLLGGNIAVSSNVNLVNNSLLRLNNNNISLTGSTSTITQTGNSYISTNGTGKLIIENIGPGGRTGAVNFPVGTAANYNPVLLTNAGTADHFSVRVQPKVFASYTGENGNGAYSNNAVDATWFISEATAGGSNAAITLQWNSTQELPGFDRNISRFGHYTGSWQLSNAAVAAGTGPYTSNAAAISSFSPFGVLNDAAVLPLHFVLFTAQKCNAVNVCLNWVTENEISVSHFILEKSTDGRMFAPVASITAKNGAVNNYNHNDAVTPQDNKIYYRLKQVDANGRYSMSPVVFVLLQDDAAVGVYPNPALHTVYISGWNTVQRLQLYDISGRMVVQQAKSVAQLDVSGIPAGLYVLKLLLKNGTSVEQKIIVQR